MKLNIPLFIAKGIGLKMANALPSITNVLEEQFSSLDKDLELLDAGVNSGEYMVTALFNAVLWGAIFGLLIFALSFSFEKNLADAGIAGVLSSVFVFAMFSAIFSIYPSILRKKDVEEIDAKLIYALNDMVMQVTAGTSLTNAMRRVAKSNYGKVSDEFRKVIELMISGDSQEKALIEVAQKSESEFMRRVLWQLATVLHTGAGLENAMRDLMEDIRAYQDNQIHKYSQNLNFFILIYLMLAVVLPSLTVLLLTTISIFISRGGVIHIGKLALTIDQILLITTIVYIACQVAVVEYIRVRRPLL